MILYWKIYLLAYLIGSIPTGLVLTRVAGHGDIRKIGSGNIGATNVMRTGNKKLAALTLLLDMLKSLIPCLYIFSYYSAKPLTYAHLEALHIMAVSGLCAVLGHIFPVWLRFRGGKGVATALGVLFALHWLLGLCFIVCWLSIFALSRYSSLSALTAFAVVTVVTCYMSFMNGNPLQQVEYNTYFETSSLITLIVFITHRQNIHRLVKGQEHKWSKPNDPA